MNRPQAKLREQLEQDINILLNRFKQFELDEEERSWHIERYINNLNLNKELIALLKVVIMDRIATLKSNEDTDTPDMQYSDQSLRQFFHAIEKWSS
ncbi:MAG: hypothetical protein AB7I41_17600 [Candidatus Sericytochromatia bacterium]